MRWVGIRAKARTAFLHPPKNLSSRPKWRDLLLACCCALLLATSTAQTLARPGWAGSGLDAEQWWRSAIFYRIDTPRFQDSDGDLTGDLHGIAQRLDYLQSLGVDAIIIPAPADESAFNDLLREAGTHRLRIIVALDGPPADILGKARQWLTRGAAGISVDPPLLSPDLHTLTSSFPGSRVLLSNAPTPQATSADLVATPLTSSVVIRPDKSLAVFHPPQPSEPNPEPRSPQRHRGTRHEPPAPPAPASTLLEADPPTGNADHPDRQMGLKKILAASLLTSHGAIALRYGQEIGLPAAAIMQWTPTNVTPPKPPDGELEQPKADPTVYGAFKPYVPPKPAPGPKPPGTPPDPDTLPGFSTTAPPQPATSPINVATEANDPTSLLNFYRRLAQLHHGNSSLRDGRTYTFDHDTEDALVWLRRAPAGARTAANVVIICNLGDRPIALSLTDDLARLHIRSGTLRPLLASWSATPIIQRTEHILLPPYSVYIGELYH